MKKLLLLAFCAFMMSINAFAWLHVPLTVNGDDENTLGSGGARSLIEPPTVYIENYALLFEFDRPDYVLQLVDENNVVVFSSVIPSGTTLFQLPTTLEGEYQIQLIQGNILYWGIIIL